MKRLFYFIVRKLSYTSVIALLVMISGCASQPVLTPKSNALWKFDTKAQITDKKKNENNTVSIELFSLEKKNYRMEITATLGYSVASVTMREQGLHFILYPQKTFVRGPLAPKSLRALFKQDIHPKLIIDLIEDRKLPDIDYVCGKQSELITKCVSDQFEVIVERARANDGFLKKINIENDQFKMVWIFKSKEFMNEYSNEMLAKTFVLEPPAGFKQVDIK